jgi:hypothetical protein
MYPQGFPGVDRSGLEDLNSAVAGDREPFDAGLGAALPKGEIKARVRKPAVLDGEVPDFEGELVKVSEVAELALEAHVRGGAAGREENEREE